MQQSTGRRIILAILFLHMLLLGITQLVEPLYALSLGVSVVTLGVVTGAFGAAGIFLSISSSSLPIHFGYRKIIRLAFLMWISVGILSLAAPPAPWLIAAQLMVGVADLFLWIPAMAYLTSVSEAGAHTKTMSLGSGLMGLGLAIGPFLGGFVAQNYDFHTIFFVVISLSAFGLLLAYRLPGAQRSTQERIPFKKEIVQVHQHALELLRTNPSMRLSSVVWMLGTAGWISIGMSLYVVYLENLGFSSSLIGTFATLRWVAITLAQFSFVLIANRIGVVTTALSGVAIGGLALSLTPFLSSAPILALVGCIGHSADRLRNPGMFTLVAENVSKDNLPTAYALLNVSWATTMTLAPPILGFVVEKTSLSVPFLLVGPIIALLSIWILFRYRREHAVRKDRKLFNPISK